MKILGVETGRVTLLVDIVEFGEAEGFSAVELFEAARQRYGFAIFPKMPTQSDRQESFRFEHGRVPSLGVSVKLFEIHPFGIVVEANTTEAADAFLDDILAWGEEEFKFRRADHASMRVYASTLVVQFENDVTRILDKWRDFTKMVSAALRDVYKIDLKVQLSKIGMRPDPQAMTPRMSGLLAEFSLERRLFAPFADEKYYSAAPLPTEAHIELLKGIENAILIK